MRSLVAAIALGLAVSHPATGQSIDTTSQAEEGQRVYAARCANCHGPNLQGSVAPALVGARFLYSWSSRGAADLFYVTSTTMPRPGEGSLSPEAYRAVFVYMLSRNGLPAGERAFDGSAAMLDAVPLEQLARASGPAPKLAPAFLAGERSQPKGTGPGQRELADSSSATNWLYHTGNYAGTRYSQLSEISTATVSQLRVACTYEVGELGSFQAGPIVDRGTLYLTTAQITAAIDAVTCGERWRHEWEPQDAFLWPVNRGVAIKDGHVVRGTADGYLVALDASDGALLWARQIARPDRGETITMPPLIFEDLVLIGPAGSENNIQGWIGAFRLSDGSPVWRFQTIPRPGEPGAETWESVPGIPAGGGSVWTPLSLDAARGELYVPVTNPAPDLPAHLRPGANLYTNALVALDVRTGKLNWYDQLVPNDFHDWDLTQVSPLVRASVRGRPRDLVIASGKDGLLRALDRRTHERLYETPVTTRRNVDQPLTKAGTVACPGMLGGVEWNGPAYHPGTGLLYVPAVDYCFKFTLMDDAAIRHVPGELYIGGSGVPASKPRGWLTAVDVTDGSVRWRYHSALPMVAAVTATAGGLVFAGEQTGDFVAFDASTGKELYRFSTGSGMFGGAATYAVNGKQYVAAAAGGGSFTFEGSGPSRVFVFSLPGTD